MRDSVEEMSAVKKWIGFCMIAYLSLGLTLFSWAAEGDQVRMYVDESPIETDQPAIISNSRTMVPVRVVSETLGCNVEWEEDTQAVIVTRGDLYLAMFVGNQNAYDAEGNVYDMGAAPLMVAYRTLVPVRFLSEYLGKPVQWDEVTNTVFINSPIAYENNKNTSAYKVAELNLLIDQMADYVQNGLFYEAESVMVSIPQELIDEAKISAKGTLARYLELTDYIRQNLELMAQGLPNMIEQERSTVTQIIGQAQGLYNQGLYYEAREILAGVAGFNQSAEQMWTIQSLREKIEAGIINIPYADLEGIRKLYRSGYYYEAYAAVQSYLQRGDLNNELKANAEQLRHQCEQAIKNYENTLVVEKKMYVTNVAEAVNFRSAASVTAPIIGAIDYAAEVGYIEDGGNNYFKIKYDGKYGYVNADFLADKKPANTATGRRYVVSRNHDVPLRDIPSAAGNVLFYIPDKSAVGFVENVPGDKYTRVTFGDYVGYIERSYLSTTQD